MKKFNAFVSSLLPSRNIDPELAARKEIYREWDRERRRAVSPSDLAEIDAIFSRALYRPSAPDAVSRVGPRDAREARHVTPHRAF